MSDKELTPKQILSLDKQPVLSSNVDFNKAYTDNAKRYAIEKCKELISLNGLTISDLFKL